LVRWQKLRTLAIGRTQDLPNPQAVEFKSLMISTGMRGAFITRMANKIQNFRDLLA